jgi:hypothetical protein
VLIIKTPKSSKLFFSLEKKIKEEKNTILTLFLLALLNNAK